MAMAWLLLGPVYLLACGWIYYVRGGAQGWLRPFDLFPGRQLTGPVWFLPLLAFVPWPTAMTSPELLTMAVGLVVIYALPAGSIIATQGMGHGSYMDAGTRFLTDNERLGKVLDMIPGLGETPMLDEAGRQLFDEHGRPMAFPNPTRDFCGMALKGLIMATIPAACLIWYFGSLVPAALFLAAPLMATAYFLNNRWWRHLGRIGFFGAPVYWAEVITGLVFGSLISQISLILWF